MVLPTRVGVNRRDIIGTGAITGAPHACGGEPVDDYPALHFGEVLPTRVGVNRQQVQSVNGPAADRPLSRFSSFVD